MHPYKNTDTPIAEHDTPIHAYNTSLRTLNQYKPTEPISITQLYNSSALSAVYWIKHLF